MLSLEHLILSAKKEGELEKLDLLIFFKLLYNIHICNAKTFQLF